MKTNITIGDKMAQKVEIVYWKDYIGGKLKSKVRDIEPYGFQLSPIAEWKMLVVDEDVAVEEGKIKCIKIKELEIPEYTIVSPLPIMRHALGCVLDVFQPGEPKKVEERKKITGVLFLPIKGGIIKKGQLVGVINVRYVKTGALKRIKSILSKWAEEARWVEDYGGIRWE